MVYEILTFTVIIVLSIKFIFNKKNIKIKNDSPLFCKVATENLIRFSWKQNLRTILVVGILLDGQRWVYWEAVKFGPLKKKAQIQRRMSPRSRQKWVQIKIQNVVDYVVGSPHPQLQNWRDKEQILQNWPFHSQILGGGKSYFFNVMPKVATSKLSVICNITDIQSLNLLSKNCKFWGIDCVVLRDFNVSLRVSLF